MSHAEFVGIVYLDRKDVTKSMKVRLGTFAPNPNGGWSKANERALAKLERKYPEGFMYEVRKGGLLNF
jgi:hypothetical protein